MLKEILKNQKNKISRWKARFRKRVKNALLENRKFYVLVSFVGVVSFASLFGISKGLDAYRYSNKQIDKRNIALLGKNVREIDDLNGRGLNLNIYEGYEGFNGNVGFYVRNRDWESEIATKLKDVEYVYKNVKEMKDNYDNFYKNYDKSKEHQRELGWPDWEPYPIIGTWDANGMGFVGFVKSASERGSFNKVLVSYSTEDMVKAKQEEPMQIIKNYGERRR